MNEIIQIGNQRFFSYIVSRKALDATGLPRMIDFISSNTEIDVSVFTKYPISNRSFENALSITGDVSGDVQEGGFEKPIKSFIEELGYFIPCSAEALSFVFYNVRAFSNVLPSNLICGIRRDSESLEELVLVLKKGKTEADFKFILEEIPATQVPRKGFEILLIKEYKKGST
jgi:hypothetical protein